MIYASLYREFVNTKETNNWDDSYEVSEHNAEDSTGSRSVAGSGSLPRVSQDADKENVPLPGHHERSVTDSTLNLQTSVDVTMLPGEPRISSSRNANNTTWVFAIYLMYLRYRILQTNMNNFNNSSLIRFLTYYICDYCIVKTYKFNTNGWNSKIPERNSLGNTLIGLKLC